RGIGPDLGHPRLVGLGAHVGEFALQGSLRCWGGLLRLFFGRRFLRRVLGDRLLLGRRFFGLRFFRHGLLDERMFLRRRFGSRWFFDRRQARNDRLGLD